MSAPGHLTPANCTEHATALAVLATEIANDRRERAEFRKNIKEDLTEINARVKATNGRVLALEKWRWFLLGGFAALSMPAAAKIATLLSSTTP